VLNILVILDNNYFNVPYYKLTCLLTPLSRVLLEKLTFFRLSEIPRILWNPTVHYLIQSALQVRGSYKHFVTEYVFTLRSC